MKAQFHTGRSACLFALCLSVIANSVWANVLQSGTRESSGMEEVYNIRTVTGPNGCISPENPFCPAGSDQTFTLSADTDYHVAALFVDGVEVAPSASYTFRNIQAPHSIEASFAINTYTLRIRSGSGDGTYPADTPVSITADDNPQGKFFSYWKVEPETYANRLTAPQEAATLFSMPRETVMLTAIYIALDNDLDLMDDAWEQLIITAEPADGISSISDVLPDDDFDQDGFSNFEEYQRGTDPTVSDKLYISHVPPSRSTGDRVEIDWVTKPGESYTLQQSTNLMQWTTVDGFPQTATNHSKEFAFEPAQTIERAYFRVIYMDNDAPVSTDITPPADDFAVALDNPVSITLVDQSELNPASILMSIGTGTYTLVDSQLSFQDGILSFDPEGMPLGTYGSTVDVSVTAADIYGNQQTFSWSFELELEDEAATNVFVFGSPEAQRAGQQVDDELPTQALAVRMAGGRSMLTRAAGTAPWYIYEITTNSVVISFSGTNAPIALFSTNTLIANLTPASVNQVFYRAITGMQLNASAHLLTLHTVDTNVEAFVENGSVTYDTNSVAFGIDAQGLIVQGTVSGSISKKLGHIAFDLDGATIDIHSGTLVFNRENKANLNIPMPLKSGNISANFNSSITCEQLHWWIEPKLDASVYFKKKGWGKKKKKETRVSVILSAEMETACVISGTIEGNASYCSKDIELTKSGLATPKLYIFLGVVGVVPFWVEIGGGLNFSVDATVEANTTFSYGMVKGATMRCGVEYYDDYDTHNDGRITWIHDFTMGTSELTPFTCSEGGISLTTGITLQPRVEVLINSLAGVSTGPDIRGAAKVAYEYLHHSDTQQSEWGWAFYLQAGLSWAIQPGGPLLKPWSDSKLSLNIWDDEWPLAPAWLRIQDQKSR